MENLNVPEELQIYLGKYGEQLYDSITGKVCCWGYKIIRRVNNTEKWNEFRKYGELKCCYPQWFLITKNLKKIQGE